MPDFIALRGDPSDGLPGAKGIGEKTAARPAARATARSRRVIARRGPREAARVRRALIEQADELRAFRDIATLRTPTLERPPDAPTDRGAAPPTAARGARDEPARPSASDGLSRAVRA